MATTTTAPKAVMSTPSPVFASTANQQAQAKSGVNLYGNKIGGAVTAGGQQTNGAGVVTGVANAADKPVTVVTPAAAMNNLSNIKSATDNIQAGIQNQAAVKAATEPTFSKQEVDNFVNSYGRYNAKQNTSTTDANTPQTSTPGLSSAQVLQNFENFKKTGGDTSNVPDSVFQNTSVTSPAPKTPTTGNAQANDINDQITQQQTQRDSAYKSYTDSINSLKNGTIPLTSSEQALIDSTTASFDRQRAAQELSNQAYQNGTQVLSARTGIDRYAPSLAQGNLAAAVSYGISKVSDIDAQRVEAVAKLQQGFDDKNYKMITDAYSAYKDLSNQKISELTKMHDSIIQQEQKDREFNQTTKTAVNKIAEDAKNNGASASVIQSILSSPDEASAIMASGKYGVAKNWDIQKVVDSLGGESLMAINKNNPMERYSISDTSKISDVVNTPTTPMGSSVNSKTGLSFAQYGLIANTDFKPTNATDQLALKYVDQYLKSGTIPTASSLGRQIKPEGLAAIDSRARDLYFKATGSSLPNPKIIKGYQDIITNNNKLANNLKIQEQTVSNNVDLSVQNLKSHDLNWSGFKPLDSVINTVQDMFNDPNVGQLIAQNQTIQNELGSLLAVKNSSGTTVHDKLAGAGIISPNDNDEQVSAKVNAIMKEATNFADALNTANSDMYKQIDPLMQDPNNPLRSLAMRTPEEKITDYYTNNPTKRVSIDKAMGDYKQKYGKDLSPEDLLEAFPEAEFSVTSIKNK